MKKTDPAFDRSVRPFKSTVAVDERSDDSIISQNDHFIERLTRTIPDILYVYDIEEQRLIYLNNQVSIILGYNRAEMRRIAGALIENLLHPADQAGVPQWIQDCRKLGDGDILDYEYRLQHKDGGWRWFRARAVVFKRNSYGEPVQVMTLAHDQTKRKQTERALKESELRNSSILKALPDLMFVQTLDGTYLDFHAADPDQLLVRPEHFLGKNMREILPPLVLEPLQETIEKVKLSSQVQACEYTIDIGGSAQVYECRIVKSGEDKILSIVRNVTEIKQTERALAESEARLRAQYRGLPIPTFTWKKTPDDFVLVDFNDEAICILNGDVKDLPGSKASESCAELPEALSAFDRCFKEKTVIRRELPGRWSADPAKTFNVTFVPVPPDMVMVHTEDITERRLTEMALRESEQFNRSIIESSDDCIKIVDREGKLLYVNPKGKQISGLNDDCLGLPWIDFWGQVESRELRVQMEKATATGVGRFQGKCQGPGGAVKWWDVAITPMPAPDGSVERLLVVSRDITEQKLLEDRLQSQERFYRSIIEHSYDLFCVLRLDGTIVYESPSTERVLGYRDEEAVGRKWFEFVHPDDLGYVTQCFGKLAQDGALPAAEYRYRHKSGHYVYLEVSGRVAADESGDPIMIVNKRDVTDRKLKEQQLHQLRLRKLQIVDDERRHLARELHDETAQDLTLIKLNLDSIHQQLSPEHEKALSLVEQSTDLVMQALRDVRTMSHSLHQPSLDEKGLIHALTWFIEMFSDRTGIQIDFVHANEIPRLRPEAETGLYKITREALNNIHRHSGSRTASVTLARESNKIILEVRDNGRGMPRSKTADGRIEQFGVGIPSMRERLRLLEGEFKLSSSLNGTTLTAVVPI